VDFSWLTKVFNGFRKIFSPLKSLKQWKIWNEIKNAYERWKRWRDWYKKNFQTYIDSIRKLQRQIYNTFFLPVLKILDTLRRASQIVGLLNKKLAAKLNSIFFRIEGALLAPLRAWQNRINGLGHIFQAILTPLGYFDRATLLNSVWRDVGQMREILRNPLGAAIAPGAPASRIPIHEQVSNVSSYLSSGSGPIADRVNTKRDTFQQLIAQG